MERVRKGEEEGGQDSMKERVKEQDRKKKIKKQSDCLSFAIRAFHNGFYTRADESLKYKILNFLRE